MGWNDSGNNDPWGNSKNSSGGQRGGANQGPPDLDELAKKLQERMGGLFGGGGKKNSGDSGAGGPGLGGIFVLALVLLSSVFLYQSFYQIEEGNRGIKLRFGRYVEPPLQPGLRFAVWPIDTITQVHVDKVREVNYEGSMLTSDENIVDITLDVQYRISNPELYLFQVQQPETTIAQVTASAIRQVVGKNTMDFVIQEGRSEVAIRTGDLMQDVLDKYQVGLQVNKVNLDRAQAPGPVQAAFEDAIKAREDEERFQREAETYANKVLPASKGRAARVLEEADAYKQSLIARAEGEASRFSQLLVEYEKAPELQRKRLYLETMEDVLGRSTKILIDNDGSGNPLLYIPVDQMLQNRQSSRANSTSMNSSSAPVSQNSTDVQTGSNRPARSRSVRTRGAN